MKTFTKNQLLVSKASSKDATRPAINGVLVEGNKTIATNGHILIMNENLEKPEPWVLNGVGWESETPFIMGNEAVKKALKNFPKVKKDDTSNRSRMAIGQSKSAIILDMSALTFQNADNDKLESQPVDGRFPNYKQILPDTDTHLQVGIDSKLLKTICEVMEKSGNGHMVLKIKNPNSITREGDSIANYPIVIENLDQIEEKITSICMPVRL
jgi:DNA polymerase III sliding clamp (beta) subunit (PCNA family)